jgi:single-stranded-DNA-specific exonuclease
VPGFNVIAALTACQDLLIKFGGHAQAAGFSLRSENLAGLRTRLAAFAAARLREEDLVPAIQVDAEVGGHDFGPDELQRLSEHLAALEPFGSGNQAPALLWRNLRVADCRVTADSKHLRFTLATPRGTVSAIAFGRADDLGLLPRGTPIDVVFSLQYNEWNGYSVLELRVKDVSLKGDATRSVNLTPQASSA